ncbi:MAG: hypothetical protein ACO3JL_14140 [Myxococcota bacterium]
MVAVKGELHGISTSRLDFGEAQAKKTNTVDDGMLRAVLPLMRPHPFAILLLTLCTQHAWAQDGETSGAALVAAHCERLITCGLSSSAELEACIASGPNLEAVAKVEHPDCAALLAALESRYQCLLGLSCDELAARAGCAAEANQVADLTVTKSRACLDGFAPLDLPPDWGCNPYYYGVGDGCDCGCGAIDPDCGDGGCGEDGCFDETCEYCYTGLEELGCESGDPSTDGPIIKPEPTPAPGEGSSCSALHVAGGSNGSHAEPSLALVGLLFALNRARGHRTIRRG